MSFDSHVTALTRRGTFMISAMIWSSLALSLMAAADEVAPSGSTSLRFDVRLGLVPGPRMGESSRTDKGPRSGRLLVVLGRAGGREPRLTVGATGMHGATILGRDVDNLAPCMPVAPTVR